MTESRKTALLLLNKYPDAHITYRGTAKNTKRAWTKLTKEQIEKGKEGFYAVILESLPFKPSVIDFDLKSKDHASGRTKEELNKIWTDLGLNGYPFIQRTPSGGLHALFKDTPDGLRSGANKVDKGVDFQTGKALFMLYNSKLWEMDHSKLLPLPEKIVNNIQKQPKIKTFGQGQNNPAVAYHAMKIAHSNNIPKAFSDSVAELVENNAKNDIPKIRKHSEDLARKLVKNIQEKQEEEQKKIFIVRPSRIVERMDKVFKKLTISLRWNLREKRAEYRIKDGKWHPFNNESNAFHYMTQKENSTKHSLKRDDYKDGIIMLAQQREEDPFRSYLEAQKWDGTPRLMSLGETFFDYKKGHRELINYCMAFPFLGGVARTIRPGCPLDEAVILRGGGGIGKSKYLESLLPNPQYYTSAPILRDLEGYEYTRSILGKVLVCPPESVLFQKNNNMELIKEFISRRTDANRKMHKDFVDQIHRQYCFVLTVNEDKVLPMDLAGYRRFLIADLISKGIDVDDVLVPHLKKHRNQLWAEAYHLIKEKGLSPRPPKSLWAIAAEVAIKHEDIDPNLEHYVMEVAEQMAGKDPYYVHTPTLQHRLLFGTKREVTLNDNGDKGLVQDDEPLIKILPKNFYKVCAKILMNHGYEKKDHREKQQNGKWTTTKVWVKKKGLTSKELDPETKEDIGAPPF